MTPRDATSEAKKIDGGSFLLKLDPSVTVRLRAERRPADREPRSLANEKPLAWLDRGTGFRWHECAVGDLEEHLATDGRDHDTPADYDGVLLGRKRRGRLLRESGRGECSD